MAIERASLGSKFKFRAQRDGVTGLDTSDTATSRLPLTQRAGVRLAGALAVPVFGLGLVACTTTEATPPSRPSITQTTENPQATAFEQRELAVRAEIQGAVVQSALSIINDLDRPNVGAREFAQTRIGNKRSIVGPDGKIDTADDRQYDERIPEMFANYSPDSNLVFIGSVAGHSEGDDNKTHGVDTVFAVDPTSPIATKLEPLTTTDFRQMFDDERTRLISVTAWDELRSADRTQVISGTRLGMYLGGENLIEVQGNSASLLSDFTLTGQSLEVNNLSGATELKTIDEINLGEERLLRTLTSANDLLSSGATR